MAFFDDKEHEGEPRGKKNAIAEPLGPLPVWGWGLVVIAGVFLWRRIAGGGSSTPAAGATTASPWSGGSYPASGGSSAGGIFLLPGASGASGAAEAPATAPATGGMPWVFTRGGDSAIWGRRLDPSTGAWTPWQSFGGQAAPGTSPSVAGNALFATGVEGNTWERVFNAATGVWSPWANLGGTATSGPGAGIIGGAGAPFTTAPVVGPQVATPAAA